MPTHTTNQQDIRRTHAEYDGTDPQLDDPEGEAS